MRKSAEKIAIIAQICITLVFVVTTLLYISNIIPQNDNFVGYYSYVGIRRIVGIFNLRKLFADGNFAPRIAVLRQRKRNQCQSQSNTPRRAQLRTAS